MTVGRSEFKTVQTCLHAHQVVGEGSARLGQLRELLLQLTPEGAIEARERLGGWEGSK